LTLTANFAPNTYTVTYDKGAHAASGVNNYVHTNGATYDANYVAKTNSEASITAASGYTFRGWSTSENPTVTKEGNVYTVANAWNGETPWHRLADLTVYAAYTANQYTLTYDCGTATGGDDQTKTIGGTAPTGGSYAYDSEVTLATTAENCALTGYTFVRWNCTGDAVNDANTGKYTWTQANDITCTAEWTANNIAISWYRDSVANGVTTPMESNQCTYDGAITLPTQPSKTGYTFQGWKIRAVSQQQGE